MVYPHLVQVIKSFNSRLQASVPKTLTGLRSQLTRALNMIDSLSTKDTMALGGFRIPRANLADPFTLPLLHAFLLLGIRKIVLSLVSFLPCNPTTLTLHRADSTYTATVCVDSDVHWRHVLAGPTHSVDQRWDEAIKLAPGLSFSSRHRSSGWLVRPLQRAKAGACAPSLERELSYSRARSRNRPDSRCISNHNALGKLASAFSSVRQSPYRVCRRQGSTPRFHAHGHGPASKLCTASCPRVGSGRLCAGLPLALVGPPGVLNASPTPVLTSDPWPAPILRRDLPPSTSEHWSYQCTSLKSSRSWPSRGSLSKTDRCLRENIGKRREGEPCLR